jgi:hypothetical protein
MLCLVLPPYTEAGLLPPGLHRATWRDVCGRFGGNPRRDWLLAGLQQAATNLRDAGAVVLWLDGSFVTSKPEPNDFDGAWDPSWVDLTKVDPILCDFSNAGRLRQKAKYGGELFVEIELASGMPFQLFFQQTPDGQAKGIVLLNLRTLP